MPSSSKFPTLGLQTTPPGGMPVGASELWTNLSNSTADDGSNTSTSNVLTSSNTATYFLKNQQYAHSIPAGNNIDGIEVLVERAGGTNYSDYEVKISGGPGLSVSKTADIGASWSTGGVATYGGPTDTWGLSWTIADIESTLFSTYVSVTGTAPTNLANAEIDYVQTIVYYSSAGGGGTNAKIRFGGQEVQNVYKGDQIITDIYFGSNVT